MTAPAIAIAQIPRRRRGDDPREHRDNDNLLDRVPHGDLLGPSHYRGEEIGVVVGSRRGWD